MFGFMDVQTSKSVTVDIFLKMVRKQMSEEQNFYQNPHSMLWQSEHIHRQSLLRARNLKP